jgi:MFS family permease
MFSTLSSYIYFPALVPIANDLGVSAALVNLTVTSYLVVAGVAPAFMGDMADQGGRRPAYLLMFTLVLASNIGFALQRSYPGLFILRMVQSAGASGTSLASKRMLFGKEQANRESLSDKSAGSYGAAYGIVADVTTVAQRGSYVGTLIFL